jgi:myosin heavy subunit
VARSGFPVRLSHTDFYSRYRGLANPFNKDTKTLPLNLENASLAEKYCQSLLITLWDEETGQGEIIVGMDVYIYKEMFIHICIYT